MVRRRCPGTGYPTRYRNPWACSTRRNAISAAVSWRGARLIRRDA
jgi:hypothetical protein